jgi:hypothetical protein
MTHSEAEVLIFAWLTLGSVALMACEAVHARHGSSHLKVNLLEGGTQVQIARQGSTMPAPSPPECCRSKIQ